MKLLNKIFNKKTRYFVSFDYTGIDKEGFVHKGKSNTIFKSDKITTKKALDNLTVSIAKEYEKINNYKHATIIILQLSNLT